MSRSLWPWAAGEWGPGCQPPRGCWALGMSQGRDPRGPPADPVRRLKPEDPLLEGSQIHRAPFLQRGVLNFKSQKAAEEKGAPPSPDPSTGTRGRSGEPPRVPKPVEGVSWEEAIGVWGTPSPGEPRGARSPETRAGPSCSPRGSGAHRRHARAERGTRCCRPRRLPRLRLRLLAGR